MDIIKRLQDAQSAAENLARVQKDLVYWQKQVDDHQAEYAVMNERVDVDGMNMSVESLLEKLKQSQTNINYITYDLNDRETRGIQRVAQERMDEIYVEVEAALKEVVGEAAYE